MKSEGGAGVERRRSIDAAPPQHAQVPRVDRRMAAAPAGRGMIKRIVSFALHQPMVIFFATALFVCGGIVAFNNLPVEAFPDVTDTQVTVITLYPGRAAEEVEKQVTIPLEVALSGLPNAVRMFSHTQFGLSFLILTFDDDANVNWARQQVGERLRTVVLPQGVEPDIAPLSTAIGEIYRYRVKSDAHDSKELRTLEDWVIERALRRIPGVADIVPMGGLIKQYEVQPDLAKLRAYKLTLQNLQTALERGNNNAGGGYVEQGGSSTRFAALACCAMLPTSTTSCWPSVTAPPYW